MARKTEGRPGGWVLLCSYGMRPEQITMETLLELRRCDLIFSDGHPHLERLLHCRSKLAVFPTSRSGLDPGFARASRTAARLAKAGRRVGLVGHGNASFLSSLREEVSAECARQGAELRCLDAVSSFDAVWSLLGLNGIPGCGVRMVSACSTVGGLLDPSSATIVFDLHALARRPGGVEAFAEQLRSAYPQDHPALLVCCRSSGVKRDSLRRLTTSRLARLLPGTAPGSLELGTLYVPPIHDPGPHGSRP
ncbi:MAG: SAM-dependent methyltransferase [Elusimicrobiota bacterium]